MPAVMAEEGGLENHTKTLTLEAPGLIVAGAALLVVEALVLSVNRL